MTVAIESTAQPKTFDFDDEPFLDKFREWLDEIVESERPDIIVAIARGAIRLIQIAWQNADHPPVISDLAVPFLADADLSDAHVLLVDDSIIIGSSFDAVFTYLRLRAKSVVGAVYAVDRQYFFGQKEKNVKEEVVRSEFADLPIIWHEELWPTQIRLHHASIVRNVARNCLDYNLDFATVKFHVTPFHQDELPFLIHQIEEHALIQQAYDVTSGWSSNSGVYRYSFFLKDGSFPTHDLSSPEVITCPKIRCTVSPEKGELHFTPIPQLCISSKAELHDFHFSDEILTQMMANLHGPDRAGVPKYPRSLLRLLTACISARLACDTEKAVREALIPHYDLKHVEYDEHDLRCSVGPDNASQLLAQCNDSLGAPYLLTTPSSTSPKRRSVSHPIRHKLEEKFEEYSSLVPTTDDLLHEAVGKLFLLLREVTDSSQVRLVNQKLSRLDVGLTSYDIESLLHSQGIECDSIDISLTLDICVDNGLAVPRFVEESGLCFRAFYSGEDEDDQNTLQLKVAFYTSYSNHLALRPQNPMTPFDLNKLAAFAKEIHDWLPIKPNFSNFGRVADVAVERPDGSIADFDVFHWITGGKSGAMDVEDSGDRRILSPRDNFDPIVKRTWPENNEQELKMTLLFSTRLFTNKKINRNAKLLLSTCPTHRHAFNSYAFELYEWANNTERSCSTMLSRMIEDLSNIIKGQTTESCLRPESVGALYWCVQYVIEAKKKDRIFHKEFEHLRRRLRDAATLKNEPAFKIWWKGSGGTKLDPTLDPEAQLRFHQSRPVLKLMEELTRTVVVALQTVGFFEDIKAYFEQKRPEYSSSMYDWLREYELQECRRRFNDAVQKLKVPNDHRPKKLSSPDIPHGHRTPLALRTCLELLNNCRESVLSIEKLSRHFVRKYQTVKGGFAFLPLADRRVRQDGTLEIVCQQHFLLFCKIVSDNDDIIQRCRNSVVEEFDRYKKSFRFFYESDESSTRLIAACRDFDVMKALCEKLTIISTKIGHSDEFSGIAKALSFGDCIQIQKGKTLRIQDHSMPSLIWQTRAMSDALAENFNGAQCDAVVIASSQAIKKACFITPDLEEAHFKKVKVQFGSDVMNCGIINVT